MRSNRVGADSILAISDVMPNMFRGGRTFCDGERGSVKGDTLFDTVTAALDCLQCQSVSQVLEDRPRFLCRCFPI